MSKIQEDNSYIVLQKYNGYVSRITIEALTEEHKDLWKAFLPSEWSENNNNKFEIVLKESVRKNINELKNHGVIEQFEIWWNDGVTGFGVGEDDLIVVGKCNGKNYHIASQNFCNERFKTIENVKDELKKSTENKLKKLNRIKLLGLIIFLLLFLALFYQFYDGLLSIETCSELGNTYCYMMFHHYFFIILPTLLVLLLITKIEYEHEYKNIEKIQCLINKLPDSVDV